MSVHFAIYAGLLVVAAALAAVVTGLAWRTRDLPGSGALAVLAGAITVWAVAAVAELMSPAMGASVFWTNVQYLGIVTVPVAWFVFALQYTGHDERLDRRVLAMLAVEPTLITLLVWTNGSHGLFRTASALVRVGPFTLLSGPSGPAFWVHTAYSYLLLVAGTWLIIRLILLTDSLFWWQAAGLFAAVAIPWVGNGAYLLGLLPGGLDPTPIAFSASGLILLGTIARHRLLDLMPTAREIARGELIDRMTDAVIVVDDRGRLTDCNPAAERILDGASSTILGEPLASLHPELGSALEETTPATDETARTEFSTWDGEAYRHYDVRIAPLRRGRGLLAGSLISVRDVTNQRQREQRLDVMNRLLRHDLRNKLTTVLGTAELLEERSEAVEQRSRARRIQAATEQLVDRADRVTGTIADAAPRIDGTIDVTAEVGTLVEAKRRAHPDAELTVATPGETWVAAGPALVAALDELLTNAIEHADSSTPRVHIEVERVPESATGGVRIRVLDEGPGIPEDELDPIRRGRETQLAHSTGVGLWLVTWIAREAGGDIAFDRVDDRTRVTLHLPAAPADARTRAA